MVRWLCGLLILIGTPAFAGPKWLEASSAHFIVYADQKESDVRQFADRLERYHNAVSAKLKLPLDAVVSPSNRVTIYVVKDINKIRKLYGGNNKFIAGFYQPRAGASVAFISEVDVAGKLPDFSEVILLHEYAHHLMFASSARSVPLWYGEGFAEYYASAGFEKNGSVWLGRPSQYRGPELAFAKNVPIEQLLDTQSYVAKQKRNEPDNFYGRSWILFHYLTYSTERVGQMAQYLDRLSKGDSEIDAAKAAFGDLKKLDQDVVRYSKQSKMSANLLSGTGLQPGPITIRALRAGEGAMMPLLLQSKRGVDSEQAKILLPEVRKVAAQFADDPAVLSTLAEAEHDAGNYPEAIAAADRSITLRPDEINAYLQKGLAMMALANDNDDPEKAWADVRKHFIKMNKVENDHPLALKYFYTSYQGQGRKPTANATNALEKALELAPFDSDLRWMLAEQQMNDMRFAEAINTITPLAFNPHNEGYADQAKELLESAKTKLAAKEADAKKSAAQ
jgi:tetratricopeptide (TPR) repeat protein